MTATTINPSSFEKLDSNGFVKVGNWTEYSCAWLDEIYNIQVKF